jgi:hypothetical protein
MIIFLNLKTDSEFPDNLIEVTDFVFQFKLLVF